MYSFLFIVVLSLNSAISTFKPDVQEMMKNFTGFAELWEKVIGEKKEGFLSFSIKFCRNQKQQLKHLWNPNH